MKYDLARLPNMPMYMNKDKKSRFGVIPRYFNKNNDKVEWFEFEPTHMYHVLNAYEDGDSIYVYGCKIPNMEYGLGGKQFYLNRWKLDLNTKKVTQVAIEPDFNCEFPVVNKKLYIFIK